MVSSVVSVGFGPLGNGMVQRGVVIRDAIVCIVRRRGIPSQPGGFIYILWAHNNGRASFVCLRFAYSSMGQKTVLVLYFWSKRRLFYILIYCRSKRLLSCCLYDFNVNAAFKTVNFWAVWNFKCPGVLHECFVASLRTVSECACFN